MMRRRLFSTALLLSSFSGPDSLAQIAAEGSDEDRDEIVEIMVRANRVANTLPAASYAAPVTALRFDPLAEIQTRGIAEGQSDVTVRGGVFENTGFKLGAVIVMDPQTGHYVAGLGVEPSLMTPPEIYSGIDNSIEGFNAAIGTVAYELRPLRDGGSLSLGAGSDEMNHQALHLTRTASIRGGNEVGASFAFARSQGDGSVPDGDHRFSRYNLLLQHSGSDSQSDLLVSHEDKFYGWPGAYTGFSTLAETDDTRTTLLLANHRAEVETGWWELGAYYRRLVDDYDFDRTTRESGEPGSFEHETRGAAIGLRGRYRSGRVSWRYAAQVTADELVRSTDLTSGTYSDRNYAKLTVVPSVDINLAHSRTLTLQAGATLDSSNRDSSAVSPQIGLVLEGSNARGQTAVALEYAATSQLPGYTALKSNPAGLFGGNPDLGRERAKQLIASITRDAEHWQGSVAVFNRRDDDLVDWTYASGAPFSRQANPVDIDVIGFEAYFARRWSNVDLAAGYTYLDKDADYGSAAVDASFYALNFARHRATLALKISVAASVEFRFDNEYRRQQDNPLREGDDATYLASLSMRWISPRFDGLSAIVIADNLTDARYQPFPGTPGAGRQLGLSVGYDW